MLSSRRSLLGIEPFFLHCRRFFTTEPPEKPVQDEREVQSHEPLMKQLGFEIFVKTRLRGNIITYSKH